MDRREAIKRLNKMRMVCDECDECNVNCDLCEEALDLAIEALEREIEYGQMVVYFTKGEAVDEWVYEGVAEKLQLSEETSTISEKESVDCISRADTIKAMCAKCGLEHSCGDCYEDSCPDVKVVMDMPSVSEEEVDYCNNCPYISWGEDCISRQQAINAVENTDINITESEWDELISVINNLPPVTPTVKVQQADTLIIAAALQNFAQDSERNISDRERAEELREQVLAYGASMCKPVTPTERTGITTDIALSLYEEIRCEALCTNPMKSDRGCDGGCQYDKELLKRIDEVIEKVLVDSPTERTGEWTNTGVLTVHCSNCKSEFHELEAMNYCPNCGAKMNKGGDDNE